MEQGITGGREQSRRRQQVLVEPKRLVLAQRPLGVRHLGDGKPTGDNREQAIPGGEEVGQLVALGLLQVRSQPHLAVTPRPSRAGPAALAGIGDLVAGDPYRHLRQEAGQPVAGPGGQDRGQAGRVQRQEPNPTPARRSWTYVRTLVSGKLDNHGTAGSAGARASCMRNDVNPTQADPSKVSTASPDGSIDCSSDGGQRQWMNVIQLHR